MEGDGCLPACETSDCPLSESLSSSSAARLLAREPRLHRHLGYYCFLYHDVYVKISDIGMQHTVLSRESIANIGKPDHQSQARTFRMY